jgi:hypothetical protein
VHIKSSDPVVDLVNVVINRLSLYGIHSELCTVLSELYNNSLEHGVLELDSGLKQFDNDFLSTLRRRAKRSFRHYRAPLLLYLQNVDLMKTLWQSELKTQVKALNRDICQNWKVLKKLQTGNFAG